MRCRVQLVAGKTPPPRAGLTAHAPVQAVVARESDPPRERPRGRGSARVCRSSVPARPVIAHFFGPGANRG
jgi:hypothetical protein